MGGRVQYNFFALWNVYSEKEGAFKNYPLERRQYVAKIFNVLALVDANNTIKPCFLFFSFPSTSSSAFQTIVNEGFVVV